MNNPILIDESICNQLAIAQYKYRHYSFLVNFLSNTNGYDDTYWKAWTCLQETQVDCDMLREQIRIKYITPIYGFQFNEPWDINPYTKQILFDF